MNKILKSNHYKIAETIAAIALVALSLVTFYIRPNSANMHIAVKWFLGVAPNFLGGIGSTIVIFILMFNAFKKQGLSHYKICLASALFSAVGLMLWEAIRAIGSFLFDWEDVIMSTVGSALSFVLLLLLANANIRKDNFDL
jgi:hypothetical protein